MLHFSTAQEATLHRSRTERFVERAAAYLRQAYGDARRPPGATWTEVVQAAIRLAESKRVHSERGVVTLCELATVYGFRFPVERPWAAYILDHSDAGEAERVERLRDYLP